MDYVIKDHEVDKLMVDLTDSLKRLNDSRVSIKIIAKLRQEVFKNIKALDIPPSLHHGFAIIVLNRFRFSGDFDTQIKLAEGAIQSGLVFETVRMIYELYEELAESFLIEYKKKELIIEELETLTKLFQ